MVAFLSGLYVTMATPGPFHLFGPSHLAVIALAFVLPILLAAISRQTTHFHLTRTFRCALAAELLATWVFWYWLIVVRGWISAQTLLPMQLCDWAAIATIVALISPSQRAYEIAYFWALSGTLQALMTPELAYDFPDVRFIVFFAFHSGVIASVLFLTLALRMRPYPASLLRVGVWSLIYLFLALTINEVFHTNFGYLSAKPSTHSLLDFMAPWPYYIGQLVLAGVGFMLLLYSPFFILDRWRNYWPKPPENRRA